MVLAFDVSTSMRCPVQEDAAPECPVKGQIPPFTGDAFIDTVVSREVVPQLRFLDSSDQVGIWTFGKEIRRGDITPLGNWRVVADEVTFAVKSSGIRGATPLNETVFEAVNELRHSWRPNAVNALAILTDGTDHGSELRGERFTEERLDAALEPDSAKPIHVLLTAADPGTCDRLLKHVRAFTGTRRCFPIRDERGRTQPLFSRMRAYLDGVT